MKLFRLVLTSLLALCLVLMPVVSSANAGSTTAPTPTKTLPAGFKFPPISEIAKRLASRANVVNYAVESLLGAVDWVLDPENNRVKYNIPINQVDNSGAVAYCKELGSSRGHRFAYLRVNKGQDYIYFDCMNPASNQYGSYYPNREKTLSNEQVAEQIVKNAKAGHAESVDFVLMTDREIALAKAKSSPRCKKEWKEATEECEKLIEKGGYRGITGNYNDVFQCAKGLVSEECGGNKLVW